MAIDPINKDNNSRNSSSDRLSGTSTGSEAGASASGEKNFRCADVGFTECKWEASAKSETELWPKIEQHGRDAHGLEQIDDATRNKVRDAIHERRAA